MAVGDIRKVVDVWSEQYEELGAMDNINHVLIFENKGSVMGCSNPHPHGQIWAQRNMPGEPTKELSQMQSYFADKGSTLLNDYLADAHPPGVLFPISVAVTLVALISGAFFFRTTERTFADIV